METDYLIYKKYDLTKTQLDTKQLARIDYSALKPSSYPEISVIVRSLMNQPLVYEETLAERLSIWMNLLSSNEDLTFSGEIKIFDSDPLVVLENTNNINYYRDYLVSKTIQEFINVPLNFFIIYDLFDSKILDNNRKESDITIVRQIINGSTSTLKSFLLNASAIDTKIFADVLISVVAQVAVATSNLYKQSGGAIGANVLKTEDIMIMDADVDEEKISYEGYDVVTSGKLAVITNYDYFTGYIIMGKERIELKPKFEIESIEIEINPIAYLIEDIVSIILNLKGISKQEVSSAISALRSILARLYQTVVADTPLVLITNEYIASYIIVNEMTYLPNELSLPYLRDGYSGPYSEIRLAYAGILLENDSVINQINILQKKFDAMCREASRLIRKKENGSPLALNALASLSSLGRILKLLAPSDNATTALGVFVRINLIGLLNKLGEKYQKSFKDSIYYPLMLKENE